MKKFFKVLLKIIKWLLIAEAAAAVIFLAAHGIGRKINAKVPENGLNESFFADINGTKQWVSIYSENKDNPVLLYLHGGPCAATSAVDWTCLHKLARDYTVVNWDQRGCGHNYPDYAESTPVTAEAMMQDGAAITDYLRERFGKEKITLMGMSWGSVLGSNLVLESPEKYDAMIALSLVVDIEESQSLFKEYMLEHSAGDPEMHALAESVDPAVYTAAEYSRTLPLAMRYSHIDNYFTESDISFLATVAFNPYCTLGESLRMVLGSKDYNAYQNNTLMPEFSELLVPLSLSGRTEYQVPFYLVEAKDDHSSLTMAEEAVFYFEQIQAPDKAAVYLEGGHSAPMMQTEALASFVHDIAQKTSPEKGGNP